MVEFDMEVVKRFIQQQHQAKKLNMRKLGIVAAGSSVGVAAAFADADWNKEPYDDAPSNDMKTPRGQDVRTPFSFRRRPASEGSAWRRPSPTSAIPTGTSPS